MRFESILVSALLISFATVSVFAQPTITPSVATLGPGQSITFHSTAGKPYWARSGTVTAIVGAATLGPCAIGLKDCAFTAGPLVPAGIYPATTTVMVYDANNWSLAPVIATITLTATSVSASCNCKDGRDGKDGRNGIDGQNGKDGKDGKDATGDAGVPAYTDWPSWATSPPKSSSRCNPPTFAVPGLVYGLYAVDLNFFYACVPDGTGKSVWKRAELKLF